MRLGMIPESIAECFALAAGHVPTPLADTMLALLLARTIMVATKVGIFEALACHELTAEEVAAGCGTDGVATEKLLFALAGAGYLRYKIGKYELAPVARKWMLSTSRNSLRDAILHRYLDAAFMEHFEEFLRTGRPLNFHRTMSSDQWSVYQRGQKAHAMLAVEEVVRRSPVPKNVRSMLDIGGGHGYYSAAFCRRHPNLHATVLDLPDALLHPAPWLSEDGMCGQVVRRAGDALTEDFGRDKFDFVLIANLLHHFAETTNRDLTQRAARALRPGGVSVILEIIRHRDPSEAGQIGGLTDLYFAATSQAGTWSFEQIAEWQRRSGLVVKKQVRLKSSPGLGLVAGFRPLVTR